MKKYKKVMYIYQTMTIFKLSQVLQYLIINEIHQHYTQDFIYKHNIQGKRK